jgi:hypothetical protein
MGGADTAKAGPVFDIADGQCGETNSDCYASNRIVVAHAFTYLIAANSNDPIFADSQDVFDSWNSSVDGGDGMWTLGESSLSDGAELTVSPIWTTTRPWTRGRRPPPVPFNTMAATFTTSRRGTQRRSGWRRRF